MGIRKVSTPTLVLFLSYSSLLSPNLKMAMCQRLAESLSHHITLPPRLPGSQDENLDQIETGLLDLLLDSIQQLGPNGEHDLLRRCVETCKVRPH